MVASVVQEALDQLDERIPVPAKAFEQAEPTYAQWLSDQKAVREQLAHTAGYPMQASQLAQLIRTCPLWEALGYTRSRVRAVCRRKRC